MSLLQPWLSPLPSDPQPYASVASKLNSFDIVLWSGESRFSRFIQLGTQSQWSHVGMVVRLQRLLFLFESTIDGDFNGVRLTLLEPNIIGRVAIRRLAGLDKFDPGQLLEQKLAECIEELNGRPFQQDKLEFIRSAYDGPFGNNTRDLSCLFCSELMAETYQRCGLMVTDLPSNEFTPRCFSSKPKRPLPLPPGLSLGPEVYLYRPKKLKASAALGREVTLNTQGLLPE